MKMNAKNMGELITMIQHGDEDAFNEVYRRYHKLVYYIAYEFCHNDADAQDILQETFVQLRKSIVDLKDPALFKSWLNRIVVNKCKNLFRSRKTTELDDEGIWFQHAKENRHYMLPEEHLHFENDQELIRSLLKKINDGQRIVLFLFYFNEMSIKEIAEALDIAEGTVKTRMMYGKQKLKKLIEAYEKATQTTINFHMNDAALAGIFAYGYEKQRIPSQIHGKHQMKYHAQSFLSSNILTYGAIAGLTAVFVGAGAMAYTNYRTLQEQKPIMNYQNSDTQGANTEAKMYYFKLMDWACCKDDMLKKSKEEFETIMPVYLQMKASQSDYLKRLIDDAWINDFETVYHSL